MLKGLPLASLSPQHLVLTAPRPPAGASQAPRCDGPAAWPHQPLRFLPVLFFNHVCCCLTVVES